jgi:hypothetical protein
MVRMIILRRFPFFGAGLISFLACLGAIAQTNSSVALAWNPSSDTAVIGYRLYQGGASGVYTNSTDVGDVTNATISNLTPGSTYFAAVTAFDGIGLESSYSTEISFVASNPPPPPPPLPAPWQAIDLGTVTPGKASVSNGVFTVAGAGNISGTSDNFRFLYQPMTGDGELRAQIRSVQNTVGPGALAGIMMRESLTSGSAYVFMGISPNGTGVAQDRPNTGVAAVTTNPSVGTPPKVWVRLVRSSGKLRGYTSTDGVNWQLLNFGHITMANSIYFGFAVASGSATALNTSTFGNATVIP